MNVEATTAAPIDTGADTIAVGVFEGEGVAHDQPGEPLGALLQSGEAGSESGRIAVTHVDGRRFLVVGLGSRERWGGEAARVAAAKAHGRARELRAGRLCWEVPHHVGAETVMGLVEGTMLHAYRFDRFKRSNGDHQLEALVLSAHHDV
ncbi:MAG TPA: M17 family peptidase N-terminal domain-containing protein, partial [Solirubrobacteraceae bacterium]|nr:M17 family peptidase N-terminal domain-containing protein [Solirubrobacteraceae bacterium]